MRGLWLLLVVLALTACAGGTPRRIFPPEASVQELRVAADGQWTALLRLRNYSTVAMRYASIDAELDFATTGPIKIALTPDIEVPPGTVEILEVALSPNAAAREAVASALAGGPAVRYQLRGEVRSSEPRGRFDFDYSSAIGAVPGLANVLR